ncbi:gas vesicle protein GvpN [Candidatus Parcubacteria bacterium]|nr:gas vesicle protein GvpN [Candidatus Parcubacteria bacterium]
MPYLSTEEEQAVIEARPMADFIETPYVKRITSRALNYFKVGIPVHFRGPTGTGKTTMALHVASKIGRPVVLFHGDEEHKTSDLVGGEQGYHYRYLKDNFISSVLKVEQDMSKRWMDNRLTIACKHGFTLIYDEFTRSKPEANNILLSILQEKVMDLPMKRDGDERHYLKVHPDFCAIFTSNPEEYAGTHKAQDALRDRMVTMDLEYFDRKTEVTITQAKSGIPKEDAEKIVDIVRGMRTSNPCEFPPTVRSCIILGKVLGAIKGKVSASDSQFKQLAKDVLVSQTTRSPWSPRRKEIENLVKDLIKKYC